jgi:nitrogen fixation protein FixH
MTGTEAKPPLLPPELEEMLRLVGDADSVELKLTVPDEDRQSAASALGVDPLDARIRQVYFFDTPDLLLDRAGVVVRARRTQSAPDDTVVKLRPVEPGALPADLRARKDFVVEVDAMPGKYVCSGSFKGQAKASVAEAAAGREPLHKLFSKPQRAFFAAHAPDGLELDDLSVLGPVHVFKLKLTPEELGRKLAVELWLYPDGERILEVSTKCAPTDWFVTATRSRDYMRRIGVNLTGEQTTKTRTALEYFAGLLA